MKKLSAFALTALTALAAIIGVLQGRVARLRTRDGARVRAHEWWKTKNMIEDKIGGVKRDNRSPTEGTDFAHLTHCTCTVRTQRESCKAMCKQCQLQDLPIMIIRFIFLLVHFSSIRDFEMIVF